MESIDKKTATELTDFERLKLQLMDERLGRVQAQVDLVLELNGLGKQLAAATDARAAFVRQLSAEYDAQMIDIDTGKIGRTPKPPKLAAVPAGTTPTVIAEQQAPLEMTAEPEKPASAS